MVGAAECAAHLRAKRAKIKGAACLIEGIAGTKRLLQGLLRQNNGILDRMERVTRPHCGHKGNINGFANHQTAAHEAHRPHGDRRRIAYRCWLLYRGLHFCGRNRDGGRTTGPLNGGRFRPDAGGGDPATRHDQDCATCRGPGHILAQTVVQIMPGLNQVGKPKSKHKSTRTCPSSLTTYCCITFSLSPYLLSPSSCPDAGPHP